MGVAALVIGIISIILGNIPYVGLLFATLPAIAGLILGIAGRRRMKTGQGIATSGIILNLLAMACIAGWTFWAFRKNGVPTEWSRKPDYTFACMNQQKQLLLALAMYCEDFDDMMPPQEIGRSFWIIMLGTKDFSNAVEGKANIGISAMGINSRLKSPTSPSCLSAQQIMVANRMPLLPMAMSRAFRRSR